MKKLLLLAFFYPRLCPAGEPLPQFSADRIVEHVKYLPGEGLQGRRAGTAGEREAAAYIARELEKAGVPPPPGGERSQRVPFYYGRAQRDMVFILMFDRAWRAEDEIRFS